MFGGGDPRESNKLIPGNHDAAKNLDSDAWNKKQAGEEEGSIESSPGTKINTLKVGEGEVRGQDVGR